MLLKVVEMVTVKFKPKSCKSPFGHVRALYYHILVKDRVAQIQTLLVWSFVRGLGGCSQKMTCDFSLRSIYYKWSRHKQ